MPACVENVRWRTVSLGAISLLIEHLRSLAGACGGNQLHSSRGYHPETCALAFSRERLATICRCRLAASNFRSLSAYSFDVTSDFLPDHRACEIGAPRRRAPFIRIAAVGPAS